MSEGLESLWGGTVASLILVSNPAIKFTVYEYLKRFLLVKRSSASQLSPYQAFLVGALASAAATVITYPVQVVQAHSRVTKPMDHVNDLSSPFSQFTFTAWP